MNHKIISEQRGNYPYRKVAVELLPQNEIEKNAIINFQSMTPNSSEKELISNYLLFNLNAVEILGQKGNTFLLKSSLV